VLEYLGRYTRRVALSNDRILGVDDDAGEVTFQWKDYRSADKHKSRKMTVTAEEFIRRFLIHVPPDGFQRIRHFGFLANRQRKQKLPLCRQLLGNLATELLPQPAQRGSGERRGRAGGGALSGVRHWGNVPRADVAADSLAGDGGGYVVSRHPASRGPRFAHPAALAGGVSAGWKWDLAVAQSGYLLRRLRVLRAFSTVNSHGGRPSRTETCGSFPRLQAIRPIQNP
jgi:hypothetical protein